MCEGVRGVRGPGTSVINIAAALAVQTNGDSPQSVSMPLNKQHILL